MSKVIKTASVFILALIMAVSSLVVTAAEENTKSANDGTIIIVTVEDDDGSTRAYELVWKYKKEYGHTYKRRWNRTLGGWYDPYWILVN
jgi:hypothetical protein